MTLIVGDTAPDFSLTNQFGETVSLSDFRGKKAVALVFYPLAFSGICTGELCELRDNFGVFETEGVELLALSVDSKFVQKSFAEQEGYKFSVLADFWPHGGTAQAYGVFNDEAGIRGRQPPCKDHHQGHGKGLADACHYAARRHDLFAAHPVDC